MSMQRRSRNIKFRENEQAWKLAKWLYDRCWVVVHDWTAPEIEWKDSSDLQNCYYDTAERLIDRTGFTTLSRLYDV